MGDIRSAPLVFVKQYNLKNPNIANPILLDSLNTEQRSAAEHNTGPLLILAGAGSGKTRVMTHRIAHLIINKNVDPESILAVTFTNKAAGEMRERVDDLLASSNLPKTPMISTFHSLCARLLRREAKYIGLKSNFVIYDDKDQLAFIKRLLKEEDIQADTTLAREKRAFIEVQKNNAITPTQAHENTFDPQGEENAFFYENYQTRLRNSNCLDFGDLILGVLEIFRSQPKIVNKYSTLWYYIMVDEFQDTNPAQMELLQHLISTHQNLAVVGDDDQAIYRWRGATIKNILNFENDFPDVSVVKLEQNYRSTQTILDAAHDIIHHNRDRKDKKLWTEAERGDLITLYTSADDREEAIYVVESIKEIIHEDDLNYNDIAIFYRTNAQARAFEEQLRFFNIPYQIVGGTSFYAREEIKDVLAYLKVGLNPKNEIDFFRVLNKPTRGIGKKSQEIIQIAGAAHPRGIWGAITDLATKEHNDNLFNDLESLSKRAKNSVLSFYNIIEIIQDMLNDGASLGSVITHLIDDIRYLDYLNKNDPERAEDKIRNVEELINAMDAFEEDLDQLEQPDQLDEKHQTNPQMDRLQLFLEKSALLANTDTLDRSAGLVTLMTVHSAKGLEFNTVFCAGMEDEVFPSSRAHGDPEALAEERRLAYVAITRAKRKLFITNARRRRIRGQFFDTKLSRFVFDIEDDHIEIDRKSVYRPTRHISMKKTAYGARPFGYGVDPEEWAFDQSPEMYKNSLEYAKNTGKNVEYDDDFSQAPAYDEDVVFEVDTMRSRTANDNLIGKVVSHSKFGIGEVKSVSGNGERAILTIRFPMEKEPIEIIRKWIKVL